MFQLIDTVHAPDRKRWLQACQYTLATSIQQLWDYVGPAIEAGTPVGADTETNSLAVFNPKSDFRIAGYNLSTTPGTGLYVPVGHLVGYEKNLPHEQVLEVMRAIDNACDTYWYGYKFDGEAMRRCTGWEPTRWQDVMLMMWMYDPNQKRFNLKETSRRVLGLEMLTYADITSGATITFDKLDPADAVTYACADADIPLRLVALPGVQEVMRRCSQVYVLERAFLPVVRRALRTGVYLDAAKLHELQVYLGNHESGLIGEARAAVFAVLGREINLRSGPQVGQALTDAGVVIAETTPGGSIATGKEVLEKYVHAHPFVANIVKYRELVAHKDNYVDKLVAGTAALGPHVWFPFNQLGAPTGRMSSGGEGDIEESIEKGYINVNIQSLPDAEKKPYLPDIRGAVVAADPTAPDAGEWVVLSIDYSQIEARLAANLSREPMWIDAFKNGVDFHARNAQLAYKDPTILDDKHPKRKKGKTMLFAVLFGATDETVAEHGGITVEEAADLMANFWAGARTLAAWIDSTHARVEIEQKVVTWLGRTRPLHAFFAPGASYSLKEEAKRLSVNGQIQGGAADIFKLACVRVDTLLTQEGWHDHCQIMLFEHDELVFRIKRQWLSTIVPAIQAVMESIQIKDWPVPFTTEAKFGPNWGERAGGLQKYRVQSGAERPVPLPTVSAPTPHTRPTPPPLPSPPSIGWAHPPIRPRSVE